MVRIHQDAASKFAPDIDRSAPAWVSNEWNEGPINISSLAASAPIPLPRPQLSYLFVRETVISCEVPVESMCPLVHWAVTERS